MADGNHQSGENLTDDAVVKTDLGTGWFDVRGPKELVDHFINAFAAL